MAIVLQVIALVTGLAGTAVGIYVSFRLYKFKDEFREDMLRYINGRFITSEVFRLIQSDTEKEMNRMGDEIKLIRVRTHDLAGYVRENSTQIHDLKERLNKLEK